MNRGIVLRHLNKHGRMGNFVVISGPPHSGKTTLLCNLLEKAVHDNPPFTIISTLFIKDPPGRFYYISSIWDLLKAYSDSTGNPIIAIDDAQGIFDATTKASTKKSKSIFDLYIHIAKLEGNLIFVAHDPNKIPTAIMEFGPLFIDVVEPGIGYIAGSQFTFSKANLTMFKAQFSGFDMKGFPLDKLFVRLSKLRANTNEELIKKNKEEIRKFLSEHNKKNDLYIPKRTEVELFLKRLGPGSPLYRKKITISQNQIAKILNVDPGYISRIKNELL